MVVGAGVGHCGGQARKILGSDPGIIAAIMWGLTPLFRGGVRLPQLFLVISQELEAFLRIQPVYDEKPIEMVDFML